MLNLLGFLANVGVLAFVVYRAKVAA